MAKRTVEQLEQAARQAEQRAKDLRAQAKKLTAKQTATLNAEIVKAVREWALTYKDGIDPNELPDFFRKWTQKNKERAERTE